MIYIVCNEFQESFYLKLARAAGLAGPEVTYVFDRVLLRELLSAGVLPRSVLIDVSLNWGSRLLQSFHGIAVAAELRRVHAVKCPIIFFSPLKESRFEGTKYGLLRAEGSAFLSFPFSVEKLKERLFKMDGLNETSLRHVVIRHSGLREDWWGRAHKLEKTLRAYPARHEEARRELSEWAASIDLYAPEQRRDLDRLVGLLAASSAEVDGDKLRDALQALDKGLLSCFAQDGKKEPAAPPPFSVPKAPPEYFTKILIADDEDLPDLVSSLARDYRYEVEQARTPALARQILDAKSPEVVLADWNFPESGDGLAFIKYALGRKYPPLILVTSKGGLRDEELRNAGLPEEVINCTGPSDAVNASMIHRKIWLGANRDNVFEPAAISPQADSTPLAQRCRERLERYATIIDSHAGRWRNFARVLRYTHRTAHLILSRASGDEAALIQRVIEILEPHLSAEEFSLEAVVGIVERIEQEHETARRPPESEAKGLLRGLLHGRIEQSSGIIGEIDNLFEQLKDVTADLSLLPGHEGGAPAILDALAEYRRGGYTRQQYVSLGETLVAAYRTLPEPTRSLGRATSGGTGKAAKVRLVVAEDDPHWQNIIRVAVAEVKARLAGGFVIEDLYFDNAAEAVKAVPRPKKEREIVGLLPSVRTIVISDICLPKDRAHADRINAAVTEETQEVAVPHRVHGLELIRTLREFAYNIPVIVLSTVDAIEDRLTVGDWGVPDINYISKGVDDYRSVVQALIRLIEKKSKHRLEKVEAEEQFWFRIDGVEIKFTREEKNVFDAFFVVCQRKEEMRRQGRQRYEPGATVDEILEELRLEGSKDNRLKIEKDFSSIREKILESFRQARRYISTHEIIKSTRRSNGTFAYQISAEIPTLEEQDTRTDAAEVPLFSRREMCKVLLVESDARNSAEVAALLGQLGYEVETADAEEAVVVAEWFRPDILCLGVNNTPPDGADGLRAVERIQTFLHDVRVAIPTAKYRDSRLLAKATQFGLSARDFVDKGRANWLSWLAAVIGKQRRQILSGEVESTSFDARLPLVEVLEGSDLDKGVLKLRVDGKLFETKGGRNVADEKDADVIHPILGLLLQSPSHPVSEEEVESRIGKSATSEMWKTWRKRMRGVIREWLGVKRGDFKSKHDDPSYKILVYKESHLILHVNVIRNKGG